MWNQVCWRKVYKKNGMFNAGCQLLVHYGFLVFTLNFNNKCIIFDIKAWMILIKALQDRKIGKNINYSL